MASATLSGSCWAFPEKTNNKNDWEWGEWKMTGGKKDPTRKG